MKSHSRIIPSLTDPLAEHTVGMPMTDAELDAVIDAEDDPVTGIWADERQGAA